MLKIIEDLILLARKRKKNPVEGSYTNKLLNDKAYLDKILLEGVERANEIASKKIQKIREIVGFF